MRLPEDLTGVVQAELWTKVWDGGAGSVEHPFTINGHPYRIATDTGPHETIFTRTDVELAHLKPGDNEMILHSDTEHHGIEMIEPGPCIILRWRK
jgi:hypothetical protein